MLRRLLFGKRSAIRQADGWDLSSPLFNWAPGEPMTVGQSVQGLLILGATGSGKTSASGRAIARAFLEAGYGGLVLCAKPDERALWEFYCHRAKRLDDLVIFGPGEGLSFNFLDYELNRKSAGAGHTENIVSLFSTILSLAARGPGGDSGRDDEGYWKRACRQLVRNLVDLLVLATGRVSIPDLYRCVVSAPNSIDQLNSKEWRAASYCYRCLLDADRKQKTAQQRADFEIVTDYLCKELPSLSDKTRSVIISTFTSLADVLNRGILRDLFSAGTNVTPDVTEDGKIILVDLPVKAFGEVGVYAQGLWKLAFQRFAECRDFQKNPRPLFLWADEAHHTLFSEDALFQTTCRSARVATVLLSQCISNFESALGGHDKGRAEAAALMANLNTKLLHANGDPVTNEWASRLLGRVLTRFLNSSTSQGKEDWMAAAMGLQPSGQNSVGMSEAYEFAVQPSVFTELRSGGKAHDMMVDAVLFQHGRRFKATGKNYMAVSFKQGT